MANVDVQLACEEADVPHADRIREWVDQALAAADTATEKLMNIATAHAALPKPEAAGRCVGQR